MNSDKKFTGINEKLARMYVHLLAFFAVNFGLFLLNVLVYPLTIWFYFPVLMWGTALIIHFCALFVQHEEEWNERTIVEAIKSGAF